MKEHQIQIKIRPKIIKKLGGKLKSNCVDLSYIGWRTIFKLYVMRHCNSKSRLMGFNVDNYLAPTHRHSKHWKNNMLLHTIDYTLTYIHSTQYNTSKLLLQDIRLECLFSPLVSPSNTYTHTR